VTALFEHLPEPPSWDFDWPALYDAYSWLRAMEACPQDPVHHAEGDVWVHTRMVCEAMREVATWRDAGEREKAVLLAAALLHDVAKPATTRTEEGRVTARGHSTRGEVRARVLLWEMDVPPSARELVAPLVRYHQIPFFLIERDDAERVAYRVSQSARCDLLAALAEADARGRVCADLARLLDNVALFAELCRERECYDRPRRFPSDHSRFLYFRKEDRDPDYLAWDDTRSDVVLMSGMPGSGKDAWIGERLPDRTVISLDDIRRELRISPAERQGRVVTLARERAKALLRRGEPFVWNATNLSRSVREQCVNLFATYRARVTIVYCEAPERVQRRQNADREVAVPAAVVRKMLERWEVPDATEAHEVVWAWPSE
jgi:putative nucleotidyltransferase with HDIG domain